MVEFTSETIRSRAFLCNYWFNLLTIDQFRFSIPSWFHLGRFCFKECVQFIWVIQFVGVQLFLVLSCNPFYFCRLVVMSPLSFLILLIWEFSFFFLVHYLKACQFWWSFQRTSFWFHWFSLLLFYSRFPLFLL